MGYLCCSFWLPPKWTMPMRFLATYTMKIVKDFQKSPNNVESFSFVNGTDSGRRRINYNLRNNDLPVVLLSLARARMFFPRE